QNVPHRHQRALLPAPAQRPPPVCRVHAVAIARLGAAVASRGPAAARRAHGRRRVHVQLRQVRLWHQPALLVHAAHVQPVRPAGGDQLGQPL
ncbi:hypothetical protein IWQ57_006706, partial [Coemansia nantahalensis]